MRNFGCGKLEKLTFKNSDEETICLDTAENQFCLEMVDVKIVVVSVVALLSVFLQPRIRAQSTISSYSEDDSCSDELEFQVEENMRLRGELEIERQRTKVPDSVTTAQLEENQTLKPTTQPGNCVVYFCHWSVGERN